MFIIEKVLFRFAICVSVLSCSIIVLSGLCFIFVAYVHAAMVIPKGKYIFYLDGIISRLKTRTVCVCVCVC